MGLSPRGRGNRSSPVALACWRRSIPAWAGKPRSPASNRTALRVYPRVGGETLLAELRTVAKAGLSPRGRGNHRRYPHVLAQRGSIPAWAGKPARHPSCANKLRVYPRVGGKPRAHSPMLGVTWVYPRVGGETNHMQSGSLSALGLSPRGRGNHRWTIVAGCGYRSIPAWAGKPKSRTIYLALLRVYPRVGGETRAQRIKRLAYKGLSPRGRGNPSAAYQALGVQGSIPAWAGKPGRSCRRGRREWVYPRVGGETTAAASVAPSTQGLSPRGRGNLVEFATEGTQIRSIPAWAGKPVDPGNGGVVREVYPRVGGETYTFVDNGALMQGLSPRGRGNRCAGRARRGSSGSIPAWAGKPTLPATTRTRPRVYPRVGGETHVAGDHSDAASGLSPRGRGNHLLTRPLPLGVRSIPAWAGKPSGRRRGTGTRRVYPRVGGETGVDIEVEGAANGLSPRGRGNQAGLDAAADLPGSIPAWAGKPLCHNDPVRKK